MSTYNKFKKLGITLVKGGMTRDEAYKLIEFITENMNGGFPVGDARAAANLAIQAYDEGQGSLTERVYDFIMSTNGIFSSTFVRHELHLSTRNETKNLSTILGRYCESGLIERTGKRAGEFRIVDSTFQPLDSFEGENKGKLDIAMPLDLSKYVKVHRSNILVLAGEKSTGKTGFALNFATLNRKHEMPKRYISSEFGADELHERLDLMECDAKEWIKDIEFNRFRGEAQDAILPDGINIVDYLEVRDGEFFKLGSQIDKIYDKLDNGIALICLQKNPGQDLARGGYMTLDKARLYITLYRDKAGGKLKNLAKIVDCKNPAIKEVNPSGFVSEYRLGGGHYFKMVTDWRPE